MNCLPGTKAVIFDMDGVLADSEALICSAAMAMFRERGLEVQPEDFHPFVGTGENQYLGGVAEKYGFTLVIPDAKQRTYELYLAMAPLQLRAFPNALELVRQCRASGLKTALASSADHIKIDANLIKIGLPRQEWDAIVGGGDVVHKKPAPDIFLAAARKMGCSPAQCVVVEDALHGIQAAKAAGMFCIAVAHTFPAEQLGEADLVKTALSEVTVEDVLGSSERSP
jgi:HAD superfamily hydrolase (TIGR01509 family)